MAASKTFRIFVSSTFSDLKEERNALQREVFPKLRELCMQHGCRFQAIDLRWGVREEAALDQQTMKICLEEIARCQRVTPRPNFIVLLGDRYGWRPLPAEIPADEFEKILDCLPVDETEKQRRHALLTQWYRRDDNAVPAVYCLLPREGDFIDFNKWEVVERELRSILLAAIAGTSLTPKQRLKYLASATEQEIAKAVLDVPDAREHVFCFFRKLKTQRGLPLVDDLPPDGSAEDFVDLLEVNGAYQLDTEARDRLERLKDRELRVRLPGNIHDYEAEWTGSGITTDHLAKLHDDVYQSLSRVIEEEIARLEKVEPLEQEQIAHENFGKERAKFFIGRAGILKTIADYVKGDGRHPLVVHGASGVGKSALMARTVEQARKDHPGAEIIVRFIGATSGSSNGRALLESLCRDISHRYGVDETSIPMEYQELVQEFPNRLASTEAPRFRFLDARLTGYVSRTKAAPAVKPLIVFIDALDQLSDVDHARNLAWLPANLPENVRLIVSTLPGECLTALERKLSQSNLIELESMLLVEGSNLLDLWLKDVGRTLQDDQRVEVLDKFAQNGLPLYLKLAFEDARRWKSYSTNTVLSPDIPGVIRDLFTWLSSDANHGQMMVARSLGYLVAAKNGVSEDELLDVLSLDEEVFQDFTQRARHEPPEQRLPVVVWSCLSFDLEPYLTERSADGASLMAFYHRQFGEAVTKEYLAGDTKQERHRGLARYFMNQPLQIEKDGKKTPNIRKVSELPHQQTHGELWPELEVMLCELGFIEAKCAAGMTYDLIADYNSALAAAGLPAEVQRSVEEFGRFLRAQGHILTRHPESTFQQAANEPDVTAPARAVQRLEETGLKTRPWLRWVNNPQGVSACLMTLVGHTSGVGACAFSPDGQRIVSGSSDKTLRLWDGETGAALATLTGHKNWVFVCAFSPDGQRIVSSAWDGTLRLWNGETEAALATLTGHAGGVGACAFSPDGRRIVSGSNDRTLRLWDGETGAALTTLTGHTSGVRACAFSPDGKRIVSGSDDETLRLWDAISRQEVCRYWPRDVVTAVNWSPEGGRLVVGTETGAIHLLRLKNLVVSPPVITVWRWQQRLPRWLFRCHVEEPTHAIGCPLCRMWSEVPAYTPGAELACSHCGKRLKLNPFTINADWWPVADAWSGQGS